ncbi:MAG: Trm112 family protein [Terracidiphilus sp.]
MEFDPGVAEMLACPACHGDLRVEGDCLVCGGCGRRYPVIDGIPVLIAERADKGSEKLKI